MVIGRNRTEFYPAEPEICLFYLVSKMQVRQPIKRNRQQTAGARRRRIADLPHETLRVHRWPSIPSSVRAGEDIQSVLARPLVSAYIGVGACAGGRTGGAGAARRRGVGGISHQRELVEETFDRLGDRREPRLGSLLRRLHRRVRLRRHQFVFVFLVVFVFVVVAVVAAVVFLVVGSSVSRRRLRSSIKKQKAVANF